MGKYYNQKYIENKVAFKKLMDTTKTRVQTPSGLDLPVIQWNSLEMISTGAIKELINKVRKGEEVDFATKSNYRNENGYLPGKRYAEPANGKAAFTDQSGRTGEDGVDAMQFGEFFLSSGKDLKMNIKNADRRVVYDRNNQIFYLTLVHYDKWVDGTTNADGSPKGKAQTLNPFVRVDGIPAA
jgi:hypothetical protein